jgi:transcriptional regulator GlxA family with amidase domain
MDIAVLLFDGLTALDAVGPYEVLWRIPGAKMALVGSEAGMAQATEGALALRATHAMADVARADLLLVPGGFGTRRLEKDERVLAWVRQIDATTTWTASVCTGSLVLGAAGLLRGRRATTHWAARDELAAHGALPAEERVVIDGKYATAAGVSAGIDLALVLAARIAGEDFARAIQLGIEYDPQPPFDAGSPAKAGPALVEIVRAHLARAQAR